MDGVADINATACDCGDSDVGHTSILWRGEVEDVSLTALVFGCLVIVTLAWEYTTEKFEELLEEHRAYKELLEKVYRELTLLGLLSFALFIKTDTDAVHMNPHLLHAFESLSLSLSRSLSRSLVCSGSRSLPPSLSRARPRSLTLVSVVVVKSVHSFSGDMSHTPSAHFPSFAESEKWAQLVGLVERPAEWGVFLAVDL